MSTNWWNWNLFPSRVPTGHYDGPIEPKAIFVWRKYNPDFLIEIAKVENNRVNAKCIIPSVIGLEMTWMDEGRFRDECWPTTGKYAKPS